MIFRATFTAWYAHVSAWLHCYAGVTLDDLPGDLVVWLVYRYWRGFAARDTADVLSCVWWR